MGIVSVEYYGNAKVTLRDDDCECSPEEMAERRRKFDDVIARLLEDPGIRARLRQINLEKYGIEG